MELHCSVTPHLKLMSYDLNSINYIKSTRTVSRFQFNLLSISNFAFNLCGKELRGLCRTSHIMFLQASSFKIAFLFLAVCNYKSN